MDIGFGSGIDGDVNSYSLCCCHTKIQMAAKTCRSAQFGD
jgi:hypothetical protein